MAAERTSQAWCKKDRVKNKTWFLRLVLSSFFKFIETISAIYFWLVHLKKGKTILPSIDNLLLLESASSLAFKIRKQQVTSEDVVKVFISRIKAVNPVINCVVDNRFELALEEAREVDKLIQSGTKTEESLETDTPFLGVPFTVKNSYSVKGLLWTSGHVKRKNLIGQFDSDAVILLKKAGAIVLASTNLPELCMWWESNNNVFGRSRNPYDTNRTTGGSSGGEGGIISAGGSPFGIGSDLAGSIRIPAFFNGIFGHKPTIGVVSNHGHYPSLPSDLDGYIATGPMSRFCADLLPIFRILVGENIGKLKLHSTVSLPKLRFFNLKNFGRSPLVSSVHPDLIKAQMKVVRHIEETFNVKIQEVKFPKLIHAMEMWGAKMIHGNNVLVAAELALKQGQISIGSELLKWCVGKSEHTIFSLALVLLEKMTPDPKHPLVGKMLTVFDDLQRELEELLGDDGVLLVPSGPSAALYHNQTITKSLNMGYTGIFNVLGMPVTQVPLGLGSWGVPIGVQVVGNLYNDHLTLAVAAELEKAFGGWVPPSLVTC